MDIQYVIMIVCQGIADDKYLFENYRNTKHWDWTTDPAKAKHFTDAGEAQTVMAQIANEPEVEIGGLLYPGATLRNGLEVGAAQPKRNGHLLLQQVKREIINTIPVVGRVRAA